MGCTREEAVQITRPPGGRVFPHPPAGPLRQVAGPAGSGAPAGHSRLPHSRAYVRRVAGLPFTKNPVRARIFFSPTLLWYERIFHAGAESGIKQFGKGTLR